MDVRRGGFSGWAVHESDCVPWTMTGFPITFRSASRELVCWLKLIKFSWIVHGWVDAIPKQPLCSHKKLPKNKGIHATFASVLSAVGWAVDLAADHKEWSHHSLRLAAKAVADGSRRCSALTPSGQVALPPAADGPVPCKRDGILATAFSARTFHDYRRLIVSFLIKGHIALHSGPRAACRHSASETNGGFGVF
jgi:hypothetical protein